ncbi:hypothetical protein EX30DRAFT_215677 [Ascodesmis nigricans]|uniref:DUF7580 domain-containing protein n=1 Tax=Ascodesmis nigricans TaxID=341454 RepID=A0A4S2MZH6_9PEZI|nr:hypothetical protein EX30DRAFT_215677 [Ascodesmis nigricans]
MSGLELAGVVLGVFPLVVSGMRFYYEGCEKIKEMRHYREVLKEFIRECDMESAKFINTCENLFEDIAPEHVSELTSPSGAPAIWKSESIQSRLRARLKGNCVQQFADAAERIMAILENMKLKFTHDDGPPNKSSVKKLRKVFNLALLEDYRKTQISSLRKLNADLYQLVNAAILTPPPPSQGALKLKSSNIAGYYKRIRDQAASVYGAVKEKLQPPSCECPNTHVVGMRLEVWKDGKNSFEGLRGLGGMGALGIMEGQGIKFTLAFTLDEAEQGKAEWRETELECIEAEEDSHLDFFNDGGALSPKSALAPHIKEKRTDSGYFSMVSSTAELEPPPPYRERVDSFSLHAPTRGSRLKSVSFSVSPASSPSLSHPLSRSPSKSKFTCPTPPISSPLPNQSPLITNLCNILNIHSSHHTSPYSSISPLGFLLSPQPLPHKHILYPPRPLPPSHPYTTTLHALLSRTSRRSISTEDRLLLGIKLANSVLSLHETKWLKDAWSTKDIVFLSANKAGTGPLLERPLVKQAIKRKRCSKKGKEGLGRDDEDPGYGGRRGSRTGPAGDRKQSSASSSLVQFRNRSLFALGIALIELWYNTPFESLRQDVEEELREGAENNTPYSESESSESEDEFALSQPNTTSRTEEQSLQISEVTPLDAALHIVHSEWLAKDAGRLYGDVVRRCVLGMDVGCCSWENEEFRRMCVETVLAPLEENFRAFRGEL